MPWRSTFYNKVTTALPADVDPAALVALLHDHGYMIHTQPIVTRFAPQAAPAPDGTVRYDVWETLQLLPCGMWPHELHFTTSFRNTRDGVATHVDAPMGFVSDATYTVRRYEAADLEAADEDSDAELSRLRAGDWLLHESIRSECNVTFKPFVLATMVSVRKKLHEGLIARAREHGVNRWVQGRGQDEAPATGY